MRTILVYLLVAVACATIREANSSPGFLSDLFQHCPLLSYLFPNDCCCDTNTSCCTTTTSTTSTTTTTTTMAPASNGTGGGTSG
ncbi:hypothetical protein ACS0PU_009324 [Formica fusca]